jgi:roadblock/LC7 domain-containing protein
MTQPASAAPAPVPSGSYPVSLDLTSPLEVQRWRPLVNWLLAIPQFIVVGVLGVVAEVLWIVSFFTVLFTKNIPEGIYNFQVMYLRYNWRVTSFAFFMRNDYPPFEFDMTAQDQSGDPATVSVERPTELNRWMPLIKWLLVIPHFIVLTFIFIGVGVVHLIAFFAVIFTGKWPEGMRRFVVGAMRWSTRVSVYFFLLVDPYPPFRLAE